jgi:hypothetical protein
MISELTRCQNWCEAKAQAFAMTASIARIRRDMPEVVKRLEPKKETLRELFLRSGNMCAFPGCSQLMLNAQGDFVGQLCHIEAAEDGGERFNETMTNEDRRQASNLMLMCYPHHVETNDLNEFKVPRLKQIKADHERRFSHPDRAILSTLKDYTKLEEPTYAVNLRRINRVLAWGLSDEEIQDAVDDLRRYLRTFIKVPAEIRNFVGKVAERTRLMDGLPTVHRATRHSCPSIRFDDLESAFQISRSSLVGLERQLASYQLGYMSEIPDDYGNDLPGLALKATNHDWCIWNDLASFCHKENESIDSFSVEMEFARLDED